MVDRDTESLRLQDAGAADERCLAGDVRLSTRSAHILAPALWAFGVALALAGLVLGVLNGAFPGNSSLLSNIFTICAVLTFPTCGLLIAWRRPENRIGWLYLGIMPLVAVSFDSFEYARYALYTNPGALPLGWFAAWLDAWAWIPAFGVSFAFIL